MSLEGLPLSLYVHIPWCLRKCPYCDFNSHGLVDGERPPGSDYVDALISDLEQALPLIWGRSVVSVFVGGGTPNLLPPEDIARLMDALRARLRLLPGAEVTLEANPGAAQRGQFLALREAGITRLSLGIQSFQPESLKALGRVHSSEEALMAAQEARGIFDRLNLDLMYGLPDQPMAWAMADLEQALSLDPGHISLYQLTLEPNTYFARFPPSLPDDDLIWEMQQALHGRLASAGYDRVEVSAFARPGHACQHNLNYWTFGDYLGIGAGAHSKLSLPERGVIRQTCLRTPADYLKSVPTGDHRRTESVASEQLAFEFMLNAMRLAEGVPLGSYAERTGRPIEDLLPGLSQAQAKGLASREGGWIRPTARGLDFLNDLQMLFLSTDADRRSAEPVQPLQSIQRLQPLKPLIRSH